MLSTLFMSFDVVASRASRIEIHGETASLVVPDPNMFIGDVELRELGSDAWVTLPPSAGYLDAARGYGIADLVDCICYCSGGIKLNAVPAVVEHDLLASGRKTHHISLQTMNPECEPLGIGVAATGQDE